jgi:signal transduction histidine kinase
MKIATWHRRLPLFLRIFAVMLAVVIAAQALNFALVLMVRLPAPRVYLLSEVAAALRSGRSSPGLTVSLGDPPLETGQNKRDLHARALLAAHLGRRDDVVRMVISRSPRFGEWPGGRQQTGPLIGRSFPEETGVPYSEIIVGRFTAAARLADGRWLVVSPTSLGIEPWQWHALLWMLSAALLVAPIAWIVARWIAAPVNLLAAAAERLGRDPSATRLSLEGPPEIVAVTGTFNAMQERLQRYVEDRTNMVAAIAHDLRTPLMRLSLLLDDVPPATRAAAQSEIGEMKARIGGILAFVRGVSRPAHRQRLNLRTLIESVADEMIDRGANIIVEDGQDVTIDADVAGMRALLSNLVENALRYANEARLALRCADGHALIDIIDDGPGIPEAQLEHVFEPFYRVDSSRSRETGGTGLGLASARAVARVHGGDVTLRNSETGGIHASVSLPL